MYQEWSLDVLYKGIDDPALQEDMKKFEEVIAAYKQMVASLPKEASGAALRQVIETKETLTVLTRRLASYFSLRRATNSADTEGAAYQTRILGMMAGTTKEDVAFEKYVGRIENLNEILAGDEVLSQYRFYFQQLQSSVSHKIGDEAEDVFARMNISGGKAWSDLVGQLTADVEVDYQGGKTTLSSIRGLADSDDPAERKAAYEAELACYDKIKDPIAYALNSIKAQTNLEAELRGFESALDMTLDKSRMQKETLDAMLQAIREFLPKFREYLKHKAKLLGHKNGLPWYDISAAMGKADAKTYTVEEAHHYLVEHFESFAPDLAQMVDTAFRDEWIDFYPHSGKLGGAFCSNLPFIGQSRVLTNFTGSFSSLVTLAHELGHAYHGQQIQDHRPLNTSYTMPVAETASNFNELIIVNDAISKAEGEEKIRLIESQIQDCTQIIVDIYSRFLFEDEVFCRRKNTFLFAKDLEEIMLNAQKEAFGDGLDPEYLHPYMWCCKSHYYKPNLSYYNFPYAFGGLFSRGLYAKYLEEGEAFLPKYRALLKATTVDTVEHVAGIAGIDLTQPEFWRISLQMIADQIDMFIACTRHEAH